MRQIKAAIAGILALFAVASASAQQFPTVPDHTVLGRIGVGGQSGPSQAIPFASLLANVASTQAANRVWAGPASGAAAGPTFRLLVGADLPAPSASTLGGVQSLTCAANQWLNQISTAGVPVCAQPAVSNLSGFGTGVAAALGNNLNAASGLVGVSGALGTPTSGTLTNETGLPISTGLTGAGTGVLAALGNTLNAASGLVGFNGALGTPTSGVLTNETGLPISTGVSGLGAGNATALGIAANANGGFPTYTATTWTPTYTGNGTPGTGQTYSIQSGSYEQIGRHITLRFLLTASSLGTAAGNLQIGGLPVTSTATANDYGTCWISNYTVTGLAASNTSVGGQILPSTNTIVLLSHNNTGTTPVTIAQAGATVQMLGGCEYHN